MGDLWKTLVRSCLGECMIRSELKCVSVCRLEGKNVHAVRGPLVDDGRPGAASERFVCV